MPGASFCYTMHDIVCRSEARRPTVCEYSRIVERLADGILGVKHGVAAFVIQFLECSTTIMLILVAVDHSRLVDGILVVRDSTELRIWKLRISGSIEFRRKYRHKIPGMAFLSDCWFPIGRRSYVK